MLFRVVQKRGGGCEWDRRNHTHTQTKAAGVEQFSATSPQLDSAWQSQFPPGLGRARSLQFR